MERNKRLLSAKYLFLDSSKQGKAPLQLPLLIKAGWTEPVSPAITLSDDQTEHSG
jgi:hypothetical protein